MGNIKFNLLFFLIFLFLLLSPTLVGAICEGPIVPCGPFVTPDSSATSECQFCHLFVLINNIIEFVLTCLTPILASFIFIIGGFYLLMAGPSPQKLSQAKSILTAGVIGLLIIFGAWVILNSFLSSIGVAEWTGLGNWWKIECATSTP